MKFRIKLFAVALFLPLLAGICPAQNDLKIKKKISMKIPGATIPDNTPQKYREMFAEMLNPTAVVYLKSGAGMRTDTTSVYPDKMGNRKTRVTTVINQCDRQRAIRFTDKKKKYFIEDAAADAKSKKGGFVTISLTVSDTGERMKLFGYNARHIKQKITVTPGANSCQKSAFEMNIDGWYADIPNFSCPVKTDITEVQMQKGCFDEVVFELKGETVTGIPVKEIKSVTADGKTMSIEEEVSEITKETLDAALFEPPADYKPANSKAEAVKDDEAQAVQNPNRQSMPTESQPVVNSPNPTLAPPVAGIQQAPLQPKKSGVIRIGIAAPSAEMGNDFTGQNTVDSVRNAIAEKLKLEAIETVFLNSALIEQEAKEKECDFIFYSKVTRKKGGGLFGAMAPIVGGMVGGMIPGGGGMATSTAVSTASMAGAFKSKDEIGFEYKVSASDGSTLVALTKTRQKVKKDGEDVLTPQIQEAAVFTLGEIAKRK